MVGRIVLFCREALPVWHGHYFYLRPAGLSRHGGLFRLPFSGTRHLGACLQSHQRRCSLLDNRPFAQNVGLSVSGVLPSVRFGGVPRDLLFLQHNHSCGLPAERDPWNPARGYFGDHGPLGRVANEIQLPGLGSVGNWGRDSRCSFEAKLWPRRLDFRKLPWRLFVVLETGGSGVAQFRLLLVQRAGDFVGLQGSHGRGFPEQSRRYSWTVLSRDSIFSAHLRDDKTARRERLNGRPFSWGRDGVELESWFYSR